MPQLPKSQSGRIVSIQVCRGLAALLVVGVHLHGIETKFCTTNHTLLFGYGAIGVDIFFVISGIVIASVTTGKFGSPRNASASSITALPASFPSSGSTPPSHSSRIRSRADEHRRINTARSTFSPRTSSSQPITACILFQGWTLSFELYFYLAFFLLLFVPERIAPWLLALWGIAIVALKLHIGLSPSALVQLLISPSVLEFLAGCALFHLYRRSRLHPAAGILLIVASLLLAASSPTASMTRPVAIVNHPWRAPLLYGTFAASSSSEPSNSNAPASSAISLSSNPSETGPTPSISPTSSSSNSSPASSSPSTHLTLRHRPHLSSRCPPRRFPQLHLRRTPSLLTPPLTKFRSNPLTQKSHTPPRKQNPPHPSKLIPCVELSVTLVPSPSSPSSLKACAASNTAATTPPASP